ncbi:MAG: V-type ATP synthase subunit F [Clostridia bacterium]|nr:V-type ATP synthase subunit F [Clostridia bacterium]
MRDGGIAIVGDKDSVLAFKAIGVDVFPVENEMQARDKVHTLARNYSVIFVTEQVALWIEMLIKRYQARPYPVIVPIPSAEGNKGLGLMGIKANVEKAIGADILFDKKEDK